MPRLTCRRAQHGAGCSPWSSCGRRSATGEIDTVVLAFTDMQGRLQGKRLSAEFFLDEVAEHYAEGCNYLLAVDVDMNTVDGYAMSSWERGYGDFVLVPDLATLRRLPWHPATALVLADLAWLDGTPGGRLAAADPPGADRPAGRARLDRAGRHRAGVRRLQRHLRAGRRPSGYRDLDPGQPVQRGLLDPRHRPDRAAAAPDPQRRWPARACTSSRPRASATSASTRSRSATPRRVTTCDNHSIYKTGAKEIAAQDGHEHHVHGQAERSARATPATSTCRCATADGDAGAGRATARTGCPRPASTSWPASSPRCAS